MPHRLRVALVISAAAGTVIAIWLAAYLVGWDENQVLAWIPASGALAAVIVLGLLVADTVLPIPGTIVMLASGVILGPVVGSAVNAVGLVGGALAGYGLGRSLQATASPRGSPGTTGAADEAPPLRFIWIAVTRGVPVLSESYAIGAGALGLPLRTFVIACALGAAPVGAVYGVAGWLSTDSWLLIVVAGGLAAGAYLVSTRLTRPRASCTPRAVP